MAQQTVNKTLDVQPVEPGCNVNSYAHMVNNVTSLAKRPLWRRACCRYAQIFLCHVGHEWACKARCIFLLHSCGVGRSELPSCFSDMRWRSCELSHSESHFSILSDITWMQHPPSFFFLRHTHNCRIYRQPPVDGLTVAGWKFLTYRPTLIRGGPG